MFCARCGQDVPEGTRFCRSCGQEVGASTAAPQSDPPVSAAVNISRPLSYAGFWLRFVAYLIDGLILGIPFSIVVFGLFAMLGGFGIMMRHREVDPRAAAAVFAPMFLVFMLAMIFFIGLQWLYFAGMESSDRQATFGKSAMSLRVANLEGQRLSFGHATGRFFSKLISGLIPLGIGYIMAGFTEKKQALHDMIAGTLVLRKL
jgi:uncharacterized RDD family membrane protein YckC